MGCSERGPRDMPPQLSRSFTNRSTCSVASRCEVNGPCETPSRVAKYHRPLTTNIRSLRNTEMSLVSLDRITATHHLLSATIMVAGSQFRCASHVIKMLRKHSKPPMSGSFSRPNGAMGKPEAINPVTGLCAAPVDPIMFSLQLSLHTKRAVCAVV